MSEFKLQAAILIISTTAAKDPSSDSSGRILKEVFDGAVTAQWAVVNTKIVGDVVQDIQRTIMQWTDHGNSLNLIVTTGGTGFATFDNTPEAISPLLHRHAPGLVHGMLAASLAVTPFAMMSRPVAGVRGKTIILTLPGSPKGAKENLQAILKLLPHACQQAAGVDSRTLHAGGIERLEAAAGVSVGSLDVPTGKNSSLGPSHSHSHNSSHGHAIPIRHTDSALNPLSNDPSKGPTRRYRESPYPMISVDDALDLIKWHSPSPQLANIKVTPSIIGSVLAEDVIATEAVPAFRASIVDGYAVTSAQCGVSGRGIFPVASVSHASPGDIPPLKAGEIARITTGAPLPPGSISVVMVEDTLLNQMTEDGKEEKFIEILAENIQPGQNVREIGSDIKSGSTILLKGEEISSVGGELGLLASVGRAEVLMYKRPVVGVLSTGDEIVEHDRPGNLRLGEVRDSNRPTVLAAVQGWGFEVKDLGVASDKSGALEEILRNALRKVDVIVTTGGVSMGELDLLKPTIERRLGGTIHFGRVAMKPGKPTTFATVPVKNNTGERIQKVIFSLPGNPASAIVTLNLFVLPSLQRMSGASPTGLPKMMVSISHDINCDSKRIEYHRACIFAGRDGLLYATSTGGQRSSKVGSLKSANALLCLPKSSEPLSKGTKVEALLIGRLQSEFDNV